MIGLEFKNKAIQYCTDKTMSVAEHEKLFNELKKIAINTFNKFFNEYKLYIIEKYASNQDVFIESIYNVEIVNNEISFIYYDDLDCETSSNVDIPLEEFVKWIDNNVEDIQQYMKMKIVSSVKKDIEETQKRIVYYTQCIKRNTDFLEKVDKMKFKDIVNWYNGFIDDAI